MSREAGLSVEFWTAIYSDFIKSGEPVPKAYTQAIEKQPEVPSRVFQYMRAEEAARARRSSRDITNTAVRNLLLFATT